MPPEHAPIRRVAALGLSLALTACGGACQPKTPSLETSPMTAASPAADSVVLERTVCFGTCPAYRVRLDRAGRILFTSLDPSDPSRTATDSISPEALVLLEREAERIGFAALPDTISGSRLCPQVATDSPTATVTFYYASSVKTVVDYHGCIDSADSPRFPELAALRVFERQVDGVTGTWRWARPSNP